MDILEKLQSNSRVDCSGFLEKYKETLSELQEEKRKVEEEISEGDAEALRLGSNLQIEKAGHILIKRSKLTGEMVRIEQCIAGVTTSIKMLAGSIAFMDKFQEIVLSSFDGIAKETTIQ